MITSTANSQVKNIIQLNTKAKARKEQDVFVVEGIRMFREVPKELRVKAYASESFAAVKENAALLEGWEYEILSDKVFAAVSDTKTPQGILCIVKQQHRTLTELIGNKRNCLMILENLQDPGNLGTILRTGEGAGISGVIMSKNCVDIYNPKTIRSTMGAIYRVPFLYTEDLKDAISQVKKAGIKVYAAHLKGTMFYDEANYMEPSAFMIGNEGNGLTDEISACADSYVKIPMEGQVESLNAGIAASLFMYEAYRQMRRK